MICAGRISLGAVMLRRQGRNRSGFRSGKGRMMKEEKERNVQREERIAKVLLDTRAVFFRPEEPFTWASGIKSPVYCDNRLILTDVEGRRTVEDELTAMIGREFPEAQALFGTATAGIPHAAIAGHAMDLPMGYVRSGAKDHGRKSRIEGRLIPGQKVVVIEDLISTGGSVISAAEALREEGAEVIGVAALFTYGLEKSRVAFEKAEIKLACLTDFDRVIGVALREGYIDRSEGKALEEFKRELNKRREN